MFEGINGAGSAESSKQYGASRRLITLWDLSHGPKDNKDRAKKLGKSFDMTRASAFTGFDAQSKAITPADGISGGNGIVANRFFEPDNWTLRLHDAKGAGIDNVWALRWIVDHCNKAEERTHRSTMVIDAHENQMWAWTMDAFYIADLGAKVKHDELKYNGAGFLAQLLGGGGTPTRGALASNIARNAGYQTDGYQIGQWWHNQTIMRKESNTQTESCGPPTERSQTVFRTDAQFWTGKTLWGFKPILTNLTPTVVDVAGTYRGAFGDLFLRDNPDTDPDWNLEDVIDPGYDFKSNQPVLPRKRGKIVKVYVTYFTPTPPPKHQNPPPHTQTTCGGNKYAAPVPTGAGATQGTPTVDTSHGATSVAHCFLPGEFSQIGTHYPIPGFLTANTWLEILMEFGVRRAYSALEKTDMAFMYRAVAKGADPGTWTQVDRTFNSADSMVAGRWLHGKLRIPRTILAGKEGGVFELWICSKTSSTGPQFILGEQHYDYPDINGKPGVAAPAGGFVTV